MSVAIIIPAYNASSFLEEAIRSALAQTTPAAQVIVVDDGSSDDTAVLATRFGTSVTVLRQENAGVSTARNFGAAQTSAEWLLFLDADDRLRPDALEKLLARTKTGAFGVVYGQSMDFTDTNFQEAHGHCGAQGPVPLAARVSFWKSPIGTPGAAIVRHEIFDRVGRWNPRFNTTADRDLWCRAGTTSEFAFIHEVIVERRVHESNMSSDKNRARRQAVEVQLGFLSWCSARNIGLGFLDVSESEIFERNVKRAVEERAFEAAAWIAEEAKTRGITSDALQRATRLFAMPGLAREMEVRVREFIGL